MNSPQILVDSGSTKADWILLESQDRVAWSTEGINPYFQTPDGIWTIVEKGRKGAAVPESVPRVCFYGSGNGSAENRKLVQGILQSVWTRAEITVETDILGAARACLNRQAGVACIIGTGSSSCLFDGSKIVDQVPALGYVIGDEGSGSWLGKELIRRYFYRELPDELSKALEKEFGIELDSVLKNVFQNPQPSRYLATFAAFVMANGQHPYIERMVREGIDRFVRFQILKYPSVKSLPVGFVGSIATLQREIVTDVLRGYGISASIFLKSPLEGLIRFHTGE